MRLTRTRMRRDVGSSIYVPMYRPIDLPRAAGTACSPLVVRRNVDVGASPRSSVHAEKSGVHERAVSFGIRVCGDPKLRTKGDGMITVGGKWFDVPRVLYSRYGREPNRVMEERARGGPFSGESLKRGGDTECTANARGRLSTINPVLSSYSSSLSTLRPGLHVSLF